MSTPVQVTVTKYRAFDGEIFEEKEDADYHESLVKDFKIQCGLCNGDKFILIKGLILSVCPRCGGNGWVCKEELSNDGE